MFLVHKWVYISFWVIDENMGLCLYITMKFSSWKISKPNLDSPISAPNTWQAMTIRNTLRALAKTTVPFSNGFVFYFCQNIFFVFFIERPAPNSYGVDVVYLFGSLLLCDSWYSKFWNMMDEKNWTQNFCRFTIQLHQRLKSNIERIKDKKGISTNLWSINLKPMPFL